MNWTRAVAWIVGAGAVLGVTAAGGQEPPAPDVAALASQIEALEQQIEALLQPLPLAVRSAVEAELARRRSTSPAADPPAGAQSEPVPEPSAAEPASPSPRPEAIATSPRGCSGLDIFDTNDDGLITGTDRLWRHFHVALDAETGGGAAAETRSAFEVGVRQIRLDLRGTINDRGGPGRMEVEPTRVLVEVTVKRRRGAQFGTLVLDADGLARSGGPRLRLPDGAVLDGMVVLRPGLVIVGEGGTAVTVTCN